MRIARHALLMILAFVLQTTWAHLLQVGGVGPDLVLLVLVFAALGGSQVEPTVLGFCIGLLQDLYTPADLGLNAFTKSAIGFSVSYVRTGFQADSLQVQVALIVCAVLVHDAVYYLGSSGVTMAAAPAFWLRYGLGRAVYTGMVGAAVAAGLQFRRRVLPA